MTCPNCSHTNPQWRTRVCERCKGDLGGTEPEPCHHFDLDRWGRRYGLPGVGKWLPILVVVGLVVQVIWWVMGW